MRTRINSLGALAALSLLLAACGGDDATDEALEERDNSADVAAYYRSR